MKRTVSIKLTIVFLALAIPLSGLLTACSGQTGNEGSSNLSGKLTISGSSSVQPLAQELADTFMENSSGIMIDVQGGGSTAGIKSANDGTADIGTSSRDLKDEEKTWELTETVIALDGIAVVIHPSNPVSDLTREQISKIFKGELRNWKEVGGSDREIIVVSREAGSGTRGAFEEIMKLEGKKDGKTVSLVRQDALIGQENGSIKANVSTKEEAIGYLSLGYMDDTVKALKVEGIEASSENVKARTYKIMRPFIFITKGAPKPHIKEFLDFILSDEGQEVVSNKYITVN